MQSTMRASVRTNGRGWAEAAAVTVACGIEACAEVKQNSTEQALSGLAQRIEH